MQSIADIDGNGVVDALTDGLLLLRYLFNVSGSSLIDGAIAINATRTSASDIQQYIEQYLPKSRLSEKRGIGYGTGWAATAFYTRFTSNRRKCHGFMTGARIS